MACALVTVASAPSLPRPSPSVRTIPLTRVVRIPMVPLEPAGAGPAVARPADALTFTPGAADELPEGPNGFDVMDDGGFLITDPLTQRIATFDSEGKFKGDWRIGFAADSVTVTPDAVVIRDASTGQFHAFDRQGRPSNAKAVLPEHPEATLLSPARGSIARPATSPAISNGPLEVLVETPGLRLLSLEVLAIDRDGSTYVAVETTKGGDATGEVNLDKVVRRYDAHGGLVAATESIPLQYYIPPVDELRVHRGTVYQLATSTREVLINVWSTN